MSEDESTLATFAGLRADRQIAIDSERNTFEAYKRTEAEVAALKARLAVGVSVGQDVLDDLARTSVDAENRAAQATAERDAARQEKAGLLLMLNTDARTIEHYCAKLTAAEADLVAARAEIDAVSKTWRAAEADLSTARAERDALRLEIVKGLEATMEQINRAEKAEAALAEVRTAYKVEVADLSDARLVLGALGLKIDSDGDLEINECWVKNPAAIAAFRRLEASAGRETEGAVKPGHSFMKCGEHVFGCGGAPGLDHSLCHFCGLPASAEAHK